MKRGFTKYSIITGLLFLFFLAVSVPQGVRAEEEQIRIWSGERAAGFAGGDGSEENPYQISNGEELAYFRDIVDRAAQVSLISYDENGNEIYTPFISEEYRMYRDAYYVLTADIYLNDVADYTEWGENAPANTIIGCSMDAEMTLTLDGAGHTIYGLYGTRALFDRFGAGTIKDLKLAKYYVNGSAVLARYLTGTTVENCTLSEGIMTFDDACGAFAKDAKDASFQNCTHAGTILIPEIEETLLAMETAANVAGFAAWSTNSVFENCKNTGRITCKGEGGTHIAGIAVIAKESKFVNCINKGVLKHRRGSSAGIAMSATNSEFTGCSNTAVLTTDKGRIGGIATEAVNSDFRKCKNSGNLTHNGKSSFNTFFTIAGIVADVKDSEIIQCSNTGKITNYIVGDSQETLFTGAAGIAGDAWSKSPEDKMRIEGCVNTGRIGGGGGNAAGIVGMLNNAGTIYNCQNHGAVVSDAISAGIFAIATWSWENGEGAKSYEIANCSNTATIKGDRPAGIVGRLAFPNIEVKKVDNCFNKGKIVSTTGGEYAAIAYEMVGTLSNCYYQQGTAKKAVVFGDAGNSRWHTAKYMKSKAFVNKLNKIAKQYEEYTLWTRKTGKLNTYPYIKNSVIVPNSTK
ncbi:MAG: hypothetical protein IJY09_03360 [Lachnospiraceae bacterium]|nr:hypothetical protein [Lachnospiraceae bacterium]